MGQGTEFIVRLPALPEQGAPATLVNHEQDEGAARRILIVDDNRDAAETLALLLASQGHKVRSAFDGPSALEIARQFRPDIVFLDIAMPGMSGYDAARQLRAEPDLKNIAIIALTGFGGEADIRRAREAGFDDLAVKPAELGQLKEQIQRKKGGSPVVEP